MRKTLVIILALPFIAASCTGDLFNFGGGTKGIYKSEDNGETFNPAVKLVNKGDIANLSINSLASDLSNPDVLYAGSSSGIYKTEDGGKSWKYILSGMSVGDIAIDKFSPATVYAAGLVGQNGKIIKSVDAGASWIDIYNEPSKTNTVLSLAVSSVSSATILAGLNNGELIKSTDFGKTWQATKDFADKVINVKFSNNASTAYALTSKKGLFSSNDLGTTWVALTQSLTGEAINSVSQSASVSGFYSLGLDSRQAGVLYLGTEQGLYRTVNDGKDWSFISLPVRNTALRVSAVTVNPDNSNHVYTSVLSTLYKSVNGGLTWETKPLPTTNTIHTIVINPLSNNIIYLGLSSK